MRLGLCCVFREQPIKFRTCTATALLKLTRRQQLAKLAEVCLANATALAAALEFCRQADIGCFRVNSQILPVKTHPQVGYGIRDLPDGQAIVAAFETSGRFAREQGIRVCFHPDQFVVLNSPRANVVNSSIAELEYQGEVSEWIGADVINIHAGGAYGDRSAALQAWPAAYARLSNRVRQRLTLENDDTSFAPADLLPLCRAIGIPLVYDVHHHRCHSDGMSVEEVTEQAISTWNRQPLFHISSPIAGWDGPNTKRHHDYVAIEDFPACWRDLDVTVEVEAKAKELAVLRLRQDLQLLSCR